MPLATSEWRRVWRTRYHAKERIVAEILLALARSYKIGYTDEALIRFVEPFLSGGHDVHAGQYAIARGGN